MTDINTQSTAARENARQATGKFGAQEHTAPDDLLSYPTLPEDVTYGVYCDGALVSAGEKGAGMADALHRARTYAGSNRPEAGGAFPALTIRSEGSDIEVTVPHGDQGRIVGWTNGDAVTAEEMDARGIALSQFDSVSVEPFIELGGYDEGELNSVEQWARDADFPVSTVHASRDEETGGRHIDVDLNTSFTWDAETQFPDDEAEDGDERTPAERYEAWLDENRDIVEQVYLEWFNADIDVPDTWDSATVTLRKTVPYERFTESLVLEDIYPLLAKWTNETDPGTFNSPYVMGEVRRRVEEREAEAERKAELEQRGLLTR